MRHFLHYFDCNLVLLQQPQVLQQVSHHKNIYQNEERERERVANIEFGFLGAKMATVIAVLGNALQQHNG